MSTNKRTNAGGLSSGDSNSLAGNSRPTDMELMLYFDDELGEPRRREIEAYLYRDIASKKKLAGLRVASQAVRERASVAAIDIDIASAVMSAIDATAEKREKDTREGGSSIGLLPVRRAMPPSSRPANDNSRGIFTLAAIAMAAAAAMMIWGRSNVEAPSSASAKSNAPAVTEEAVRSLAQAAPKPAEPAPVADAESENGVEVAAVDFGAHTGTIFYVPSDALASNATTTVVWVDDEVVGGK